MTSGLGADGSGSVSSFRDVVFFGNYTLSYAGAQVYGASDPSVCEVFFVVNLNPVSKRFSLKMWVERSL